MVKSLGLSEEVQGFLAAVENANTQMQKRMDSASYFDDLESIRQSHRVLVQSVVSRIKHEFERKIVARIDALRKKN